MCNTMMLSNMDRKIYVPHSLIKLKCEYMHQSVDKEIYCATHMWIQTSNISSLIQESTHK